MTAFMYVFSFFFIFGYNIFVRGYVGFLLYYWFLIPAFGFLPEITYLQTVGVLVATLFFTNSPTYLSYMDYQEDEGLDLGLKVLGRIIAQPWMVLFVGWLVKNIIY